MVINVNTVCPAIQAMPDEAPHTIVNQVYRILIKIKKNFEILSLIYLKIDMKILLFLFKKNLPLETFFNYEMTNNKKLRSHSLNLNFYFRLHHSSTETTCFLGIKIQNVILHRLEGFVYFKSEAIQ